MTREELLKQETITFEEVLKYFDVRNYAGLMSYFYQLTGHTDEGLVNINDGDLYFGFKLVYDKILVDSYNPLQERIMLYSVIMRGIYGFDIDDFSIMTSGLGIFRTAMFFDELFRENEEAIYYQKLYREYYNREESIGTIITKGIESLITTFLPKIEGLTPETLAPYEAKIKEFMSEFKENFKN